MLATAFVLIAGRWLPTHTGLIIQKELLIAHVSRLRAEGVVADILPAVGIQRRAAIERGPVAQNHERKAIFAAMPSSFRYATRNTRSRICGQP